MKNSSKYPYYWCIYNYEGQCCNGTEEETLCLDHYDEKCESYEQDNLLFGFTELIGVSSSGRILGSDPSDRDSNSCTPAI